jgi:phage-Barnase-EndoU-ColicinE5/D-RelE like nuclease3
MPSKALWNVYEKHIRRSKLEAPVMDVKVRITKTTRKTRNAMHCRARKTYIRTRALKHLYDKKPAEEFDFILDHIMLIIRNPDCIYRNRSDRHTGFCLTRKIDNHQYLAVIELVAQNTSGEEVHIVTAFRIRDDNYLRNYDLLRSWRDGAHSS